MSEQTECGRLRPDRASAAQWWQVTHSSGALRFAVSLPLGTCIEVVNLGNGRRVLVRVNDRGPYVPGRTIDLSHRAAEELGMVDDGLARVRILRAKTESCAS